MLKKRKRGARNVVHSFCIYGCWATLFPLDSWINIVFGSTDNWKDAQNKGRKNEWAIVEGAELEFWQPWILLEEIMASKWAFSFLCWYFQFVPLIGIIGCSSYALALVMHQYDYMQLIPWIKGLAKIHFYYQDLERQKMLTLLWISYERIMEMNRQSKGASTTKGYPTWRKNREYMYTIPS